MFRTLLYNQKSTGIKDLSFKYTQVFKICFQSIFKGSEDLEYVKEEASMFLGVQ